MRIIQSNILERTVSPTHLELGLLLSTMLMLRHDHKGMPEAFKLLAEYIPDITCLEDEMAVIATAIKKQVNGSLLLCSGFEAVVTDTLETMFKSVLVVPNSNEVDFERLAANYIHHPEVEVATPFQAANLICPDTSILVPIYPLQDGMLLSYNYPSKLLTVDARRNSYQIIGLEICNPLPLQYGYDQTGLTRVMTPVDPAYFTDFFNFKY